MAHFAQECTFTEEPRFTPTVNGRGGMSSLIHQCLKQILKIVGQWINGEQKGYCFGFEGFEK